MQDTENKVVELNSFTSESQTGETKDKSTEKIGRLSDSVAEADKKLEELNGTESRFSEDLIYQENEWLKSRMEADRKNEERQREELFEKQKVLEERRQTQAEGFAQSRQMQLYNRMHEDEQRDMVYALHGISVDKEQGMKEYKNALYQGAQIILFFVDVVLCGVSGYTRGLDSVFFMACIALTASQATLLPREHKGVLGRSPYSIISMILSFIPTPAMAFVLLSDRLNLLGKEELMLGVAIGSVALCLFGAADYFIRNPYREARAAARAARSDIRDLKRSAARTVKKNQKLRARLISRLTRQKDRDEQRIARLKEREEQRFIRAKSREEQKAKRLEDRLKKQAEMKEKYSEVSAMAEENRKKRKELRDQKIVDIKTRINSMINRKAN